MLEDNEFRPGPAFQPEGMLRWLSKIRPEGAPEPAMEDLISPERFAADLDKVFRMRVAWWGGHLQAIPTGLSKIERSGLIRSDRFRVGRGKPSPGSAICLAIARGARLTGSAGPTRRRRGLR
jgi:hypothetical protein